MLTFSLFFESGSTPWSSQVWSLTFKLLQTKCREQKKEELKTSRKSGTRFKPVSRLWFLVPIGIYIVNVDSDSICLSPSQSVKWSILFANIVLSRWALKWHQAMFGVTWFHCNKRQLLHRQASVKFFHKFTIFSIKKDKLFKILGELWY